MINQQNEKSSQNSYCYSNNDDQIQTPLVTQNYISWQDLSENINVMWHNRQD